MSRAKLVQIEVLPNRHVTVDDRLRGPGEAVDLHEPDALTLIADGYAKVSPDVDAGEAERVASAAAERQEEAAQAEAERARVAAETEAKIDAAAAELLAADEAIKRERAANALAHHEPVEPS